MNQTGSFLLGIAIGMAGLYCSMHYTLVRATDGFHVIPKIAAKLDNPYTDIRKYGLSEWQKRQRLALSILKAKKGYLLKDPSLAMFKQSTQRVLDQYSGTSLVGFSPSLSKPQ